MTRCLKRLTPAVGSRARAPILIEVMNRTRADFAEQFEALIEGYNADSRSIEELFAEAEHRSV